MLRLTKPYFNGCEFEAVKEVFEGGWLAEGDKTEQFERLLAQSVGAKYAVAVCNCTVAIELCLRAQQIDDYVVIPAFTHKATELAVINAECVPVYCDVNLATYNMESVSEFPQIPVSWGGNPTYYADNVILEDAACSLGAVQQTCFPLCFSFHPRKLITTGEGGAITTNRKDLAETLRSLKNFGYSNYKFDDIRASIGIEQLKKLNYLIKIRQQMARIYDELLKDLPVVVPNTHHKSRHVYQTYAVLLKKGNRNEIIDRLKAKSIETQIGTTCLDDSKPNAKLLGDNLLSLPMAYDISFDQQVMVVDELKSAISKTSHH